MRVLRQPAIAEPSRFIGTCLGNSDRPDAADRLASHRARSWSHIHDVLGVSSCSRGNARTGFKVCQTRIKPDHRGAVAHSVTDLINFIGLGYELQGCRREALPKRAASGETNWEKWAGEPRPDDAAGASSYEQLLRMDGDFTAALERAFAADLESQLSARRIYVAKG